MSATPDRSRLEDLARGALGAFAGRFSEIVGAIAAASFGSANARAAAHAILNKADDVFGRDLTGHAVSELDEHGLQVGDVHIDTDFAGFAEGRSAMPVSAVSVEHAEKIALPTYESAAGSIATTVTLTLTVTCKRSDTGSRPVRTAKTTVSLECEYESPERDVDSDDRATAADV